MKQDYEPQASGDYERDPFGGEPPRIPFWAWPLIGIMTIAGGAYVLGRALLDALKRPFARKGRS